MNDKLKCKKCGFDDEFITDYKVDKNGDDVEFVFCGNCGTVKGDVLHRDTDSIHTISMDIQSVNPKL